MKSTIGPLKVNLYFKFNVVLVRSEHSVWSPIWSRAIENRNHIHRARVERACMYRCHTKDTPENLYDMTASRLMQSRYIFRARVINRYHKNYKNRVDGKF